MGLQAKVCYEKATGKVLFVATEYKQELPKDYYMKAFIELKNYIEDEIDFVNLDYETYKTTFTNAKSYNMNLETKQLDVTYYTTEELNTTQQQNQETQDLYSRVSDISTYLSNSDETAIADIENSILQKELNNLNGGM